MKKPAAHPTTTLHHEQNQSAQLHFGRAFLDTTWRILVPVVIFTLLGIGGDRHFNTAPWLTLLGVIVGFVFAGLLVKQEVVESEDEE